MSKDVEMKPRANEEKLLRITGKEKLAPFRMIREHFLTPLDHS